MRRFKLKTTHEEPPKKNQNFKIRIEGIFSKKRIGQP
jgi:hypothetical protein